MWRDLVDPLKSLVYNRWKAAVEDEVENLGVFVISEFFTGDKKT